MTHSLDAGIADPTPLATPEPMESTTDDGGAVAAPNLERSLLRPRTILSFLFAAVIVVFFVRSVKLDFTAVWARMRAANPLLLVAAFAVYYCTFVVRGLRWRTLLGNVGYSREDGHPMPSVAGLVEILYLSWFTNCIVPARLGDAYRGYMLKKSAGVSFTVTLGTILAERLIDITVLAAMMSGAALVAFRGSLPAEAERALLGGVVLSVVGIGVLLVLPRLRPLVHRLLPQRLHAHYAGLESGIVGSFRRIPQLLGYSIVAWLIEGTTLFLVARAVGAPVTIPAAIVVALIASLLSIIPFTPAGLGMVEAGFVLVLTQLGLNTTTAGAVSLLDRVVTYWSIIFIGAIVYIASRKK